MQCRAPPLRGSRRGCACGRAGAHAGREAWTQVARAQVRGAAPRGQGAVKAKGAVVGRRCGRAGRPAAEGSRASRSTREGSVEMLTGRSAPPCLQGTGEAAARPGAVRKGGGSSRNCGKRGQGPGARGQGLSAGGERMVGSSGRTGCAERLAPRARICCAVGSGVCQARRAWGQAYPRPGPAPACPVRWEGRCLLHRKGCMPWEANTDPGRLWRKGRMYGDCRRSRPPGREVSGGSSAPQVDAGSAEALVSLDSAASVRAPWEGPAGARRGRLAWADAHAGPLMAGRACRRRLRPLGPRGRRHSRPQRLARGRPSTEKGVGGSRPGSHPLH